LAWLVEPAWAPLPAAATLPVKAVALTTTLAAGAFAEFDNLIAIAPDFTRLALPELQRAHQEAQQDA